MTIRQWRRRFQRLMESAGLRTSSRSRVGPRLDVETLEARVTPALSPPASLMPAPDTRLSATLSGDFDGDGRTDSAAYQDGRWMVSLADADRLAAPSPWATWPHAAPVSLWARLIVGDFNGDGKDDIAGLRKTGAWHVGISAGDSFASSEWEAPPRQIFAGMLVGDFDGDTNDDILGLTTAGELRVALSDGSAFTTSTWADGLTGAWTRLLVGDFDGDKKSDIAGLKAGQWTVGLSLGTSFDVQSGWGTWDAVINPDRVAVGDFDGDDRDDVSWVTPDGIWKVGLSDGSIFDTVDWGAIFGGPAPRLVGDFDGDGRDDIAVFGTDRTIRYSDDAGVASTQAFGFLPRLTGARFELGDWNADLKADIFITAADGERFVVLPSAAAIPAAELIFAPYVGSARPYVPGTPMKPGSSRHFIDSTPLSLQKQMDFNTPRGFEDFVFTFRDALRTWTVEAERRGLTETAALRDFLKVKLDDKFLETQNWLAQKYPGLSESQYRLLMAMNLAHGHYRYGKGWSCPTVWQLLSATEGNCAHFAHLVVELATIQGIQATHYALQVNVGTEFGRYTTGHNLVFAEGMLIDAEVNVAFHIGSFAEIRTINPAARLATLLSRGQVYGFFNYLNYTPIRNEQLSRLQDGGVIQFTYAFTLRAIGGGISKFWDVGWRPA